MNEEKKSLGRGLDSLLGERAERSTQGVLEVPLEDLVPGQYQPCLLYTSPSPRDLSTSRMPSSA